MENRQYYLHTLQHAEKALKSLMMQEESFKFLRMMCAPQRGSKGAGKKKK
jgi:hypothetical protein